MSPCHSIRPQQPVAVRVLNITDMYTSAILTLGGISILFYWCKMGVYWRCWCKRSLLLPSSTLQFSAFSACFIFLCSWTSVHGLFSTENYTSAPSLQQMTQNSVWFIILSCCCPHVGMHQKMGGHWAFPQMSTPVSVEQDG